MPALMIEAPAKQMLFAGAALVCAVIASVYDVRERRIPNRLTGPSLAVALVLHFALGGWNALGSCLLAALAAGGVFLVFFVAGGMGAGDVKLMAAVTCISGLASLQTLLLATVLSGGLFALVLAASRGRLRQTFGNVTALIAHHCRRGLTPHAELNLANQETLRLPFALPIAAGCAAWLSLLAWGRS